MADFEILTYITLLNSFLTVGVEKIPDFTLEIGLKVILPKQLFSNLTDMSLCQHQSGGGTGLAPGARDKPTVASGGGTG